jgi:hypothetical protein
MVEVLVVAGLVVAAALLREAGRRCALRRARARAEWMLDDLAASACAALAEPGRDRRAERALERYATARDRVAAATTPRELERMVRRHELRLSGYAFAARGLERARDLIAQAVPARR